MLLHESKSKEYETFHVLLTQQVIAVVYNYG